MTHSKAPRGFSLVELLAVMTVMALLTGLVVPSIGALAGGRRLDGAISLGANVFSSARQNSISKGVLTAVVVLTDTAKVANAGYRTIVVLELAPRADGSAATTQDWKQISKWEVLPTGVIVDNSTSGGSLKSEFLRSKASGPTDPPMLPDLVYKGSTFAPDTGYSYQVFTPQGRMICYQDPSSANPPPISLQFSEGAYSGNIPVYTQAKNSGVFVFNDATGEFKIRRP